MRIQISIDSATTSQTRDLLAALNKIGKAATVGLNGSECWTATTAHLNENEFATVVGELVKADGVKLAQLVKEVRVAR